MNKNTPETSGNLHDKLMLQAAASRVHHEAELVRWEQEHERETQKRLGKMDEGKGHFLKYTEAIPATPYVYAAWLAQYLAQGGEITRCSDYNLKQSHSTKDYHSSPSHFAYWMPRKLFAGIPTHYGAASMRLLLLPDMLTDSNLTPTSGDPRKGREYGHSTVIGLRPVNDTQDHRPMSGLVLPGLEAFTNEPDNVESFPNVEEIIADEPNLQLLARLALESIGFKMPLLTNSR